MGGFTLAIEHYIPFWEHRHAIHVVNGVLSPARTESKNVNCDGKETLKLEYGMGGKPSINGDVYSFGVLLLEMFTGKQPTNDLFGGSFTLHNYTKSALPKRVLDITDKSILESSFRRGFDVSECLVLVLEVGLRCCEESPTNRMAISEAVRELVSIKEKFFKARKTTID